jgi:uncharacterized protein YprB with RNaseH-like and TPR domain
MSSFSAKLERVHLPSPPSHRATSPSAESPSISSVAPIEAAIDESTLPSDPAFRLEALRRRIARILTKTSPVVKRTPADPSAGDLPFLREDTPLGPLYVRTRRLSAAHRVGRAAVQPTAQTSAGMLALLSLDPSLAALDPRRALYLDTETTGLSGGAGTVPFLIGLAWFDVGSTSLVVEQLLLREMGEEAPMLERLARRVSDASMLVTYNGKSFDVPLLRTRYVLNRLPAFECAGHLDLVHVARRVHRHRLAQLNLKNVESQVLGFERTADISGGEVCSRYTHFLRTGDDSALAAVIDHNEWDIEAMVALVGLYGEPLLGLAPADWVGLARTVGRAGSLDLAGQIIDRAVDQGVGSEAVRARGEIAKARGDKAAALADFASIIEAIDDPSLRLELAKLYEHHAKAPLAALELVDRGTGENPEATSRRRRRLEKKRDRRKA